MRVSPPLALVFVPLALLAACGDDPTVEPDPDAAAPEPDAEVSTPEPETITIHAPGTQLVAVREGDGAWRAVEVGANGDATADVRGPYTAVSVCEDKGFFNYYAIHAAPSDGPLNMTCSTGESELVILTIDPEQVGRVYIGNRSALADGTLVLLAGTYDVFVVDDSMVPPRVAVRRDVVLDADQTVSVGLDDFLFMNETTVASTETGASGMTTVRLTANGTSARITSEDPHLFPPAIMQPGDRQTVSISDSAGANSRSAYTIVAGDEAAIGITLPAGISGVLREHDGDVTVSWDTTDTWEQRYFYLADAEFTQLWDASVLDGYAAANPDHRIVLPDPADVPGWDAAWGAPGAGLDLWLLVSADDATGGRSAIHDSTFAKAARVDAPRAVLRRAGLVGR